MFLKKITMEKIIQAIVECIFIALAGSAISMTLTKATISKSLREKVQAKSKFFGELLSCPYCTSHWIHAILVIFCRPLILTFFPRMLIPGMNYLIVWFALVSLSSYGSGLIYKSLSPME
ncbi:MAG: DUF1360 domain-containing protein [bacterium]